MFNRKDDDSTLGQPLPSGWQMEALGLLGKGGMSRVYLVKDEVLGREVALKVIRPELQKDQEAYEYFVEEAKITAQLDHPNIPPVYALAAEKKRTTCFTMKVLKGESFQKMLERNREAGPEGLFAALEVLIRVCDAVAFAHTRGIIHCDLKPANVMVAEHGQIYVVDWGLARRKVDLPKSAKEDDERSVGTPAYMAPEQARGQNYLIDERTDVFLLGGMLYRILAGYPPYVAQTAEDTRKLAATGVFPPPTAVAPPGRALPPGLVNICLKALSPDPAGRYQDVGSLRKDLEDFIHGIARLPEQVFEAGQDIVKEGEAGNAAYIILDGHCQVSRMVAGKRQLLRLLGPGEMFGEAAVLTAGPRLATVTAMMETTVAVVDRSFLEDEMARTSLISLAIRAVASSFLDLNGQTAALLKDQGLSRATELLLRELALWGREERDGSRWIPWKSALAKAVAATQQDAEAISQKVQRMPGLRVDELMDRLVLAHVGQ